MNYSISRKRMVEQQLRNRGIKDAKVLEAMMAVPRHMFVAEAFQGRAYGDCPLPIGERQTISQPYMVGYMTEALMLQGGEKVLEIGTGSGYQAAVLGRIAGKVYSVERIPELARQARRILDRLGTTNINVKVTDGTFGWEEEAPFDGIMVTAGAPHVPDQLKQQLVVGGRLVVPVGDRFEQKLLRIIRRRENAFTEEILLGCRFVPLIGRNGWKD